MATVALVGNLMSAAFKLFMFSSLIFCCAFIEGVEANDEPSEALKAMLDKNRIEILSGSGVFVESRKMGAVVSEDIERELARFGPTRFGREAISAIAAFFDLKLEDNDRDRFATPHWCRKYMFKGQKQYLAYAKLDDDEAFYRFSDSLSNLPDQRFSLTTQDGNRLTLTEWHSANVSTNLMVVIDHAQRIAVLDFAKFGRLDEYISQRMLNKGRVEVVAEGRKHRITIGQKPVPGATLPITLELVVDNDREYMVDNAKFFLGETLWMEREFSDYMITSNGFWFPHSVRFRRYVPLGGKQVVSSEEVYRAIHGSVDFNNPIEDEVFSPQLPAGARGVDFTQFPPKDFIVTANGLEYVP